MKTTPILEFHPDGKPKLLNRQHIDLYYWWSYYQEALQKYYGTEKQKSIH